MLASYLKDHLTGAEAGHTRALDMAERYADEPYGPELASVARQINREHGELIRIVDRLGLHQPLAKRALARAVEFVGRAKPNGRLFRSTPTTPLLELELLRSAVNGKQGLWQTLGGYAEELGIDPDDAARWAQDSADQSDRLERIHEQVRTEAFRP